MTMNLSSDVIYSLLAGAPQQGYSLGELADALDLPAGSRARLRVLLQEMARSGLVVYLGRRYTLQPEVNERTERVTGLLRVTPRGGRGFVDLGEAYEDVLVEADDQGAALDGDTVEVQTWEGPRRRQGRVVAVVSRGRTRVTGVLERSGALVLDDPRLNRPVEVSARGPAAPGQAVLAEISRYPQTARDSFSVSINRVLGEPGLLVTEVARSVAGGGVDEDFPEQVQRAAERLPPEVRDVDRLNRLDLRHLHFVTIDPRTARDFDDAVAIEDGPEGMIRVWVAVADVSEYVEEGSALDQEARQRGCSIYLPDRAIPMLPPALSSHICSLVPEQDRLAMVVRMDITPKGQIHAHGCSAAVIHSQGRLDYGGVAAALSGDLRGQRATYAQHLEILERLQQVTTLLNERRLRRGSLDLDLPEAEVVLDADDPDLVRDIVESRPDTPIKRAYNLVEELMVAANEVVARTFEAASLATIWRIHAPPQPDALVRLGGWLRGYGIAVSPDEIDTSRGTARLLKQIKDHRAARALSYLVLRTLKQASYSVTNVGHFGLASKAYLHFTSPIRRYPDLHVHRLLKALLRAQGKPAGRELKTEQLERKALTAIARESSQSERRAIEIERDVRSLYAASLVRNYIGDTEWATIMGVTSFGFFAALDDPFVEGLVKLDSLPGRFAFDGDQLRLFARQGGKAFSLGDRLEVRIVNSSVARRQIDLELVPGPESHLADPLLEQPGRAARPGARGAGARRGEGQRQRRAGGGKPARGGRQSRSSGRKGRR